MIILFGFVLISTPSTLHRYLIHCCYKNIDYRRFRVVFEEFVLAFESLLTDGNLKPSGVSMSCKQLSHGPECCVIKWSAGDGRSPWQLREDDSWGGNWEMGRYYECKSLCELAYIAELPVMMQSLGTVQALYPSKISHFISSNATCHCGVHFHTHTVNTASVLIKHIHPITSCF